jgi:hypothetical protein
MFSLISLPVPSHRMTMFRMAAPFAVIADPFARKCGDPVSRRQVE